ncbi:MAG: hypothetical protein WC655_27935 [Candidatus Hydrogenedentales bacterium]|jgi:hypothetical protein
MTSVDQIHDMVDRLRRDAIQRRNAAKNATSEMYYEGIRVGLEEAQDFVARIRMINS